MCETTSATPTLAHGTLIPQVLPGRGRVYTEHGRWTSLPGPWQPWWTPAGPWSPRVSGERPSLSKPFPVLGLARVTGARPELLVQLGKHPPAGPAGSEWAGDAVSPEGWQSRRDVSEF